MEEKKMINTPPSSLMNSTASPKVKTMKGKKVGAPSLVHNTLGVKGCVRAPKWD
jgi:hypothetical protein